MSAEIERRMAELEEALMQTRLELQELKQLLVGVTEGMGLTARGGLAIVERVKRLEARLGMEP